MMNKILLKMATKIHYKFPFLRPYLSFIYDVHMVKFAGWGMRTIHELPWNDEYDGEIFRKASTDIKKIEFSKGSTTGIDRNNVDTLLWRHWIVSYSIRHAIEFAESINFNFVECGVADGITAFFALREICGHKKTANNFSMHLYDAWNQMRKEGLLESELSRVGGYVEISIDRTKRNLTEFKDNVVYHQGYIPESFSMLPEHPNQIIYLHIDLNSANNTLSTLEFFYPRLVRGGVILFDDYGSMAFEDTKKTVDAFFFGKSGILLKFPTGQAIYFC